MKNFLILFSIIFTLCSCNKNSLENLDVNSITTACDYVEATGVILDEFEVLSDKYGFKDIDDFDEDNMPYEDWQKIKMIAFKVEEMQDRAEIFEDIYDDYKDFKKALEQCPDFKEIDMKMEYFDLD